RPVDQVAVVPVVRAGPHHDHRAAVGALRVPGELPGDADHQLPVDAGDLLLPGGGVRLRVVIAGGPLSGQAGTGDAELGGHQVEHGGHQVVADAAGRHPAATGPAAFGVAHVEPGQVERHELVMRVEQGERGVDVAELEVPAAGVLLPPAVADGLVRDGRRP